LLPADKPSLREQAVSIWWAGTQAVDGQRLIADSLSVDGDDFIVDSVELNLNDYDRIVVVGGGKATASMTRGLIQWMQRHPRFGKMAVEGWVNVPEGHEFEDRRIVVHPARPAGVNEPTLKSIAGTEQMTRLLKSADPRTLGIVLISGGGSALICQPAEGVTLDDKLALVRKMSAEGATIQEINAMRTRLSRVKGGGMARSFNGRDLVTLIISDVLGDPIESIASGPTYIAQDDTSLRFGNHIVLLGNNAVAVDEAGIRAESLGFNHLMHCQTAAGETAEQAGENLAETIIEILRNQNSHRHDAVITGGEPVVHLADASIRGKGGRNQQLILAAYRRLRESDLSPKEWNHLVLLSGGTDGEDGPTDAAGAMIDGAIHQRAVQLQLDIDDSLRRNDAYTFFEAAGGLFKTGPTHTNVCDLRVGLVRHL
jgi:glycerate 2-kinase